MTKTFSITQVSKMSGVSKNRIREWADKGLLAGVQRISVGSREHRRFTQSDIQLVMRINEYQDMGYVLKMAGQKAKEN
jgi:DNA-binding transcriptional MerR regulator